MADRFPSLEDIDGGETEARDTTAAEGSFLDRERALLGEDAEQFTGGATVEDDDDDLLGGGDYAAASHAGQQKLDMDGDDDLDGFESSFPAISKQNENVGPGGSITNTSAGYTNYNPASTAEDSEPVRAWREKRDQALARRDEASARKKEETVGTARKDIDTFYESYNRKSDKQKAQTAKEAEEFLAKREDTTSGGTSWERIAKLADLSGKGQGGGGEGSTKKRMREMLLSLRGDKSAPGVAGV